ncbi:LOW QUALITY PROTEIN: hypothetical protein YC2023_024080 [Brassica napus]
MTTGNTKPSSCSCAAPAGVVHASPRVLIGKMSPEKGQDAGLESRPRSLNDNAMKFFFQWQFSRI